MDLDKYTDEMRKSIWDKAFFMDKIIGAKCVIDFGCADGAMIRMLGEMFPQMEFFGYDNNNELINMGWHAINSTNCKNVHFYREHRSKWSDGAPIMEDSIDDMINIIKAKYKSEEICLNFSSVLHEIFSSSESGKTVIQRLVNELEPRYITIRDMYFDYDKRFVKLSFVSNIINKLEVDEQYIQEFEAKHGTIMNWEGLIHFLMKYQWKDNGWEQELEENYFSWWLGDLIALVGDNYLPVFQTNYQLPYYTEQWKQFFFKPEIHTHAQFILRRDD